MLHGLAAVGNCVHQPRPIGIVAVENTASHFGIDEIGNSFIASFSHLVIPCLSNLLSVRHFPAIIISLSCKPQQVTRSGTFETKI